MRVFLFIFFLFLSVIAGHAQYLVPNTFFGYEWGTPYKTVLKKTKESNIKFKAEKDFEIVYKQGEEDIKLIFDNGLIQAVKSRTYPTGEKEKPMAYMNGLLDDLVKKYGNYHNPRFHQNELMIFEWKFEKTMMTLLYYFPTNTVSIEYARL